MSKNISVKYSKISTISNSHIPPKFLALSLKLHFTRTLNSQETRVMEGSFRRITPIYALQDRLSKTKCLVSSTRVSRFVSASASSSRMAVAARRHEPNPTFSKQISTYRVPATGKRVDRISVTLTRAAFRPKPKRAVYRHALWKM